jgi:hypothetical protein
VNEYDTCQAALRVEHDAICQKVLDLLDELDAVEILRAHTPSARRHLVDRLETGLRLIGRIDGELGESVWMTTNRSEEARYGCQPLLSSCGPARNTAERLRNGDKAAATTASRKVAEPTFSTGLLTPCAARRTRNSQDGVTSMWIEHPQRSPAATAGRLSARYGRPTARCSS